MPLEIEVQEVKLVRDAHGAICTDCGCSFGTWDNNQYWGWRKSQAMHERGCGHKMKLVQITQWLIGEGRSE